MIYFSVANCNNFEEIDLVRNISLVQIISYKNGTNVSLSQRFNFRRRVLSLVFNLELWCSDAHQITAISEQTGEAGGLAAGAGGLAARTGEAGHLVAGDGLTGGS